MLAKNTGIKLKHHSKRVAMYATAIANRIISNEIENKEDIINIIKLSALLHDIGKVDDNFQNLLKGLKNKKSKFRHNEIGWAIVCKFISHKDINCIASCVYWHHGISNKMCADDLSSILENSSIPTNIEDILNDIIDTIGIDVKIGEKRRQFKTTPSYFIGPNIENFEEINNINLIIRSCVISADRIVSSLEEDLFTKFKCQNIISDIDYFIDENIKYPDNYLNTTFSREIFNLDNKDNIFRNNSRYAKQMEIASIFDKTNIINGPAGFGKTIMPILAYSNNKNPLIWICPNNSVSISVYNRILDEIKNLGISNTTVELYLTGEVKESNHDNKTGFSSDIIITNIDNYLKPMIDNSSMSKLYTILKSDVVFDEYDVLLTESALFACFINIMQVRHRYTDSNTVLLSATPINIECYWDNDIKQTKILPGKYKHYMPAHNEKYSIKILDNIESIDLSGEDKLCFVNSISLSQKLHRDNKDTMLIHSEFEKHTKEEKFNKILKIHGKNGNKLLDNSPVISTHVLQASFDISFRELYDSVLSPQSSIQRIGRCNRDGKYSDSSIINIIKIDDRSENLMKGLLYDNNLSDMWFSYLNRYNNTCLTLENFYEIYNNFEKENIKLIDNHIQKKFMDSYQYLISIYPIKYETGNKPENITAGSNKLRYTTTEVFVIAKKYGEENSYCDPFTTKIYNNSFERTFNEIERGIDFNKMKRTIKSLEGDCRFDYSDILNKYNTRIGMDDLRNKYAKKSDTPYIRFDEVYHNDFGFIKQDFLINKQ